MERELTTKTDEVNVLKREYDLLKQLMLQCQAKYLRECASNERLRYFYGCGCNGRNTCDNGGGCGGDRGCICGCWKMEEEREPNRLPEFDEFYYYTDINEKIPDECSCG